MNIGSYKIQRLLGEGAFGRVYEGRHRILDLRVCIKQEKTQEKPYTTMFREEAILLSKLRHPSCPAFLDYLEEPGDVGQLIVLSFIDGTPMDKILDTKGPIDDEHICWILDRILSGLSYLHGKHRIVHCDLKPANAILDIEDHQVTLVDFGLATLKPNDKTLAKGGTPGYIPPEFALGFPPIPASDIYSVGKIGIALAGGDVNSGEPPKNMPSALSSLLLRMIRRDPIERPQAVDPLRGEITQIRQRVWGRTSCKEQFKYRGKS
jgi:serine/threonine-protein kinase